MIDEETKKKTIEQRVVVYSQKQIPVHITKHDGEWLNGFVSEVSADFIMLQEFKKGLMPVFFTEIKNVETYIQEGSHG